jgi:hypothetical protein
MGGWVDGWMGGWVDGWMGGWVDGWMGRKGRRLIEERLVPFEAARHVDYPMIVHVRFIGVPFMH